MAIQSTITPVLQSMSAMQFDGSTASAIQYASAISGLDVAQQKLVLSTLGLSEAQQAVVLSNITAASAVTQYTVAQFGAKIGADAAQMSLATGAQATDRMTAAMLSAALASGHLSGTQKEQIATTLSQAAANTTAATSYNTLGASMKAAAGAMTMTPVGWITILLSVLPLVITGVTKLYDWLVVTSEEAYALATEHKDAYDSMTEDAKNLEEELETVQSRMEELERLSKSGALTLTDQDELKDLQLTNAELKIKLERMQAIAALEADEANRNYEDSYNRETYDSPIRERYVVELQSIEEEYEDSLTKYTDQLNGMQVDWAEGEMEQAAEIYGRYIELVDGMRNGLVDGQLLDTTIDAEEYLSTLLTIYDELNSKRESGMVLSEQEQQLLADTEADLLNFQEHLDSDILGNYVGENDFTERLRDQIDAISRVVFPTEFFNAQLVELDGAAVREMERLGASASLTADDVIRLAGQFPELSGWMEESGYAAEQLAEHFNALGNVDDVSLSDYQTRIEGIEEELRNLQNTYGGTVDLINRKKIEYSDANIEAVRSWGGSFADAQVGDGTYMTVASQTFRDGDAAIVVTPILPDGTVLDENTLKQYFDEMVANAVDGNYGAADTRGILMGVFDEGAWEDNLAASDAFAISVHNLHEEWNATKDAMQIALSGTSFDFSNYSAEVAAVEEKVTDLQEALDKIRDGSMDNADILGLLEDYPSLAPYVNDLDQMSVLIGQLISQAGDGLISKLMGTTWASTTDANAAQALVEFVRGLAQSVSETDEALASIAAIEGGIESLGEVLGSFQEDGYATADALSELSETFGSMPSFQNFVNVMTDSSSTMEQAKEATNDLAEEWLNSAVALGGLTDGTKDLYVNQLKRIGVTNALEVVESRLRVETAKSAISATDFATATAGTVGALLAQAEAAGIAADALDTLRLMFDLLKREESGNLTFYELNHFDELLNNYKNRLTSGLSGSDMSIELPPIDINVPVNRSGSGSSSDTDEYIAELDKVYKARKRLADIEEEADAMQLRLDNSNSLQEQILLQRQLTNTYERQQAALHELNDARDAEIASGVERLRQLGFEIQYNRDTNDLYIDNLEHINELQGSNMEATNEMRKAAEELWESISDLNDENKDGSSTWWELKYSIADAREEIDALLTQIVEEASEAVDAIQDVYDTLHEAADEYAASGFITVDTLQSILGLGVKYVAYLMDENGQLVINEERIRDVIAAKTEQMAIDSSMAYIEALRLAQADDNVEVLNDLLYATQSATDATWGLVYANLGILGLGDDQYQAALNNINAIRALADSAISSIGQVSNSVSDELDNMKSGMDDILDYVMDMLRHRIEEQVEALEGMKDAYSDIISLKKESLQASKDEANYQKTLASRLREIARLQARIDALSLDDSREAQAERAALLDEMAELQEELSETQADHALESTETALDKMEAAYHLEKDKEIEILEDSISSTQKLYDLAIDYISNNWNTLYSELIDWNTQYGSVLNSEISSAWDNCLAAAQRYGSYVNAMGSIDADIEAAQNNGVNTQVGNTNYDNSFTNADVVKATVNQMKERSALWSSADNNTRKTLNNLNKDDAATLKGLGVNAEYDEKTGVWLITADSIDPSNVGKKLYDCYHSGGIVGGGTTKDNERLSLLKDEEWVLNDAMINNLATQMERITQLNRVLDSVPIFSGQTNWSDGLRLDGGSTVNNVTNNSSNQPIEIVFGDTVIHGANTSTVNQHVEVTRDMVNQIVRVLGLRR